MQCIKEFTNTSLVQVAQETLETRAHTVCMRKIPYTCLHPRLSASWMPASPPDGSRPPHTHTHSLLLFRFSISCSGEDSLMIHFRGSLVTLSLLQLGHVFIASVVGGGERECDDYTRDCECFWQVGPTLVITCLITVLISTSTAYKNNYNNKYAKGINSYYYNFETTLPRLTLRGVKIWNVRKSKIG